MKNKSVILILLIFLGIVICSIAFARVSEVKKNMIRILGDTKKITEGLVYDDLLFINETLNSLLPQVDRLKELNSEKQFQEYAEKCKTNILNMRLYCKRNSIEELAEEYKSMLLNTCMKCHKIYRTE